MDRNLFQIYLSTCEESLPSPLVEMQKMHREVYASHNYFLYGMRDLRQFLCAKFSAQVVRAFDSLRPFAYKADLGRYCLIYHFGGWYSDITLKPVLLYEPEVEASLIYFYDHGNGSNQSIHGCQNGLFYARKGHPLMAACIEQIIRHCEAKYYGPNPLSPTGPNLFGNKVVNFTPADGVYYGYFMPLTAGFKKLNRAYVSPEGDIVAWHKTSWNRNSFNGSLASFGAKGVNNYLKMWLDHDVYN